MVFGPRCWFISAQVLKNLNGAFGRNRLLRKSLHRSHEQPPTDRHRYQTDDSQANELRQQRAQAQLHKHIAEQDADATEKYQQAAVGNEAADSDSSRVFSKA